MPGRAVPELEEAPREERPPKREQPVHARGAVAPLVRRQPAPVADRGGERRVSRGQVEIGGKLDLHGHTFDSVRTALASFLHRQQDAGARTVIVVTGKGRGGEEGLLRRSLPTWLDAPSVREMVAGYAQAHRSHGGAGAFYVFLKRREE